MRRLPLFAVVAAGVLAGTLAVGVQPADAHICANAAKVPVGRSTTVALVVAVEEKPVPDIEFTLPNGLRLDRVDPKPDWTFTRDGSTIRYHGGPAATYSCQRFAVAVTPEVKAAYPVSAVQRDADGNVVARSTPDAAAPSHNPYLEQYIWAGIDPPPPPSQTQGASPLLYVGVGFIVVALGLMTTLFVRNRRLARADELQDRVETFKAQTRDQSPSE